MANEEREGKEKRHTSSTMTYGLERNNVYDEILYIFKKNDKPCFKFCFDLKWMRKRRVNKKLGVGWRSVGRGGILVYRMVE